MRISVYKNNQNNKAQNFGKIAISTEAGKISGIKKLIPQHIIKSQEINPNIISIGLSTEKSPQLFARIIDDGEHQVWWQQDYTNLSDFLDYAIGYADRMPKNT
jgi:hypothetical protein